MATKHVNGALGTDDESHGGTEGAGAWKTINYALRNGGMAHGDILYVAAGTYATFYSTYTSFTTAISGTFDGSNFVQVIAVGEVFVDIPSNVVTQFFYPGASNGVEFVGVQFRNPSASTVSRFFRLLNANGTIKLTDCDVDCGGVAMFGFNLYSSGISGKIILDNTDIHNSTTSGISAQLGAGLELEILNGSRIYNCARTINMESACTTTLIFDDSCSVQGTEYGMRVIGAGHTIKARRSIITGRYNDAHDAPIYGIYADSAAMASWKTYPDRLDFDGSKVWMFGTIWTPNDSNRSDDDNDFGQVIGYSTYFVALPETCIYAHPGFELADVIAGNFLPDYTHPTLPAVVPGTAAFFGDSIMAGVGASSMYDPATATAAWAVFGRDQSFTMVGNGYATIPGMSVSTGRFHADRMLQHDVPEYCFCAFGINNLLLGTPHPVNETSETIAAELIKTFKKISNAGSKFCWLGITSNSGTTPDNANIVAVNALVAAACEENGWVCGESLLSLMQQNTNWAMPDAGGGYYEDLETDVHPNDAGHALIAEAAEILLDLHKTGTHWGLRVPFSGTIPSWEG